ncbi:MAG TPA: hypothetical protein VGA38_05700 [Candidatus Limnocylindria bacterium]
MTTLLLDPAAHRAFDLALRAPRFTMWRLGSEVRLAVDDPYVAELRRALAVHGVRAVADAAERPEHPALVRAIGLTLEPARLGAEELDVVEVRVLSLAEATRSLLRRRIPHWPLGDWRRARCRALLREDDTLLEIRRTAWCGRTTLRSARRTLRPVLFDPTTAARPIRRYASQNELSRWVAS